MDKPPPAKPRLKKGEAASWNWGKGKGEGKITEVFTKDTTKTIKGAKITRHATPEKPAVEIKTAAGKKVLKSASEIKVK